MINELCELTAQAFNVLYLFAVLRFYNILYLPFMVYDALQKRATTIFDVKQRKRFITKMDFIELVTCMK